MAEGGAEDVTTWLLLPGKNQNAADKDNTISRIARAWKGMALRHLLESTMFWAGNDVNAAIAAYCHALRLGKTPVAFESQNHVPKHQDGSWLVTQLNVGDNEKVHLGLFDSVIGSLGIWLPDPLQRLYLTAQMRLVHPTSPDADDALRFLALVVNRRDDSGYIGEWLTTQHRATRFNTYWFLLRLAQFLQRHKGRRDAEAVINFGISMTPDWFKGPMPTDPNAPLMSKRRILNEHEVSVIEDAEGPHVERRRALHKAIDELHLQEAQARSTR